MKGMSVSAPDVYITNEHREHEAITIRLIHECIIGDASLFAVATINK